MDWIKKKGYAGAMTWAIDMDDFHGLCGPENALMKVLYENMKDYNVPEPTVTTTPRPEWARPPSTQPTSVELDFESDVTTPKTTVATTKIPKPTETTQAPTTRVTRKKTKKTKKPRPTKVSLTTTTTTTTTESPTTTSTTQQPVQDPEVIEENEETNEQDNISSDTELNDKPDCTNPDLDPEAFYPHSDCSKFYRCDNSNAVEFSCKEGLLFNPDQNVCDWPANVESRKCIVPPTEENYENEVDV